MKGRREEMERKGGGGKGKRKREEDKEERGRRLIQYHTEDGLEMRLL